MSPDGNEFRSARRTPSNGMLVEEIREISVREIRPKSRPSPIPRKPDVVGTIRRSPSSPQLHSPVVLNAYKSEQELLGLGPDRIKAELQRRGLKSNGTLEEQAQRLWSIRGLNPADYPKSIIADKE